MPRYYLDCKDGRTILDIKGKNYSSLGDAIAAAKEKAADIRARTGRSPETDYIAVVDEGGQEVARISIDDAS